MSANNWAALAVSITTLFGVGIVCIRHLVRTYLMELKPNGGSSLRDEQNRQGETIKRLEERIDSIYEFLIK